MVQETGETRDAIIEDDNRQLQDIIYANRDKKSPYWIVVYATPSKARVDGKPTLIKHIKAYSKKPVSQVGMICAEVSNESGLIKWEVNMPQKPFDFNALVMLGAKPCNEVIVETTSIPQAYLTK